METKRLETLQKLTEFYWHMVKQSPSLGTSASDSKCFKSIAHKRERCLCNGMDWDWLRHYSAEWEVISFLPCSWTTTVWYPASRCWVKYNSLSRVQDYLGIMSGLEPLPGAEPYHQFLKHHIGKEKPRVSERTETALSLPASSLPALGACARSLRLPIWTHFSPADILFVPHTI